MSQGHGVSEDARRWQQGCVALPWAGHAAGGPCAGTAAGSQARFQGTVFCTLQFWSTPGHSLKGEKEGSGLVKSDVKQIWLQS